MRGDAPIYPLRPFALFVLLFPHLIAGPIVRHNELVPQFAEDPLREGLWQRFSTSQDRFRAFDRRGPSPIGHVGIIEQTIPPG